MKRLVDSTAHCLICFVVFLVVSLPAFGEDLLTISGKVINRNNRKAIENVTLSVPGSNIATVSNAEGRFTLKIPVDLAVNGIRVFQLGYRSLLIPASEIDYDGRDVTVTLEPIGKQFKEIVVTSGDPERIVIEALQKIPENYSDKNNLFSGFYRETVRKGSRFVSISEAILDVLKRPYKSRYTTGEKVQINKGRTLLSQKASDTLAVKLTGGPYMAIYLDAVKNGDHLFTINEVNHYDFKMEHLESIDDRLHFRISFKPHVKLQYPLNRGVIYIDTETFAISRVEFALDMSDKEKVTQYILQKKPSGLHFKPEEVSGVVTYKLVDGKSYIHYISSIIRFKCDWKKRLFSSGYTTHAEIVMVDRDDNPEKNIKFSNTFGRDKVFSDIVENYWEEGFWDEYNIIEPTESLEKAIDKLKKRK